LISGVQVFSFNDITEAEKELTKINANPMGVKIMALKAVFKSVKITDVDSKTANMLKQEMLSRGGDIAVSKDAGSFDAERTDIIIMGSLAQHIRLIKKLQYQKFGECRKIAKVLQEILFADQDLTKFPVW
jgi:dihydropteroate synthase